MKTPMQEMLEWVRATLPMDLDWPMLIEQKVKSLLEKEKEFIRKIYWEGGQDVPQHSSMVDAWYNENFNTKEK